MPATILNLVIEQGAKFSRTVNIGTDFNGETPTAKIRDQFGGVVLATIACSEVEDGETILSLTAAETAALTVPAGTRIDDRGPVVIGAYEAEIDDDGAVRVLQGKVSLSRRTAQA